MGYASVGIGAVLAGKYRVERVLGQGGMGIVVQAMHLQLQQPVAMKFLLPAVLAHQPVVQRFLREAQAAVRLKSEHVARVIDVGTLETGAPYMVLEYLEGVDLSKFPSSQLTVGGIVDLVLQACEALAEAHAIGIVHRDIKPANFFITRGADGTPLLKLLDFGISKSPMTNGQLTATQAVMGTPAYMSPEQMRSSHGVDHRSDIWSLGVVLYEIFQGTPPFAGDTLSSMVLKVANDPLPKLTVRLPGDLESIVYRCLEKDPAKRFQNTAELALVIAKYAQSETQAALSVQRTRAIVGTAALRTMVAHHPSRRALPSTFSGSAGARTISRRIGRRWPILVATAVVAAGIVVTITAVGGGGGPEGESPSARPDGAPNAAFAPALEPPRRIPSAAIPAPPPLPVATMPTSAPPPTATPSAGSAATAPSVSVGQAITHADARAALQPSMPAGSPPKVTEAAPGATAKNPTKHKSLRPSTRPDTPSTKPRSPIDDQRDPDDLLPPSN